MMKRIVVLIALFSFIAYPIEYITGIAQSGDTTLTPTKKQQKDERRKERKSRKSKPRQNRVASVAIIYHQ